MQKFGELEGTDGKLHVLVNNSGIAWGEAFETFPEKAGQWGLMLGTPLTSE